MAGLVTVCPTSWTQAFLAGILSSNGFSGDTTAVLGIFDPKADEEHRVHPGRNKYRNPAPVNADRLKNFVHAMASVMTHRNDVTLIFGGQVKSNNATIEGILAKQAPVWSYRIVRIIFDREALRNLWRNGVPKHDQARKRPSNSVGSATYSEDLYICWALAEKPKFGLVYRCAIDQGSETGSDVIMNVPVVDADERAKVPAAIKDRILAGSSWQNRAASLPRSRSPSVAETMAGASDIAGSDCFAEPKKKRKRRRALLRQPSTDDVECFSFPTHPMIIKEFLKEFRSTWCVLGTPELGVCMAGALSGDTRVPVLAFTRNETHSEYLKRSVKRALVEALVDDTLSIAQPKVTQKSLKDMWSKIQAQEKEAEKAMASSSDTHSGASGPEEKQERKRPPKKPRTRKPTAPSKAKNDEEEETEKTEAEKAQDQRIEQRKQTRLQRPGRSRGEDKPASSKGPAPAKQVDKILSELLLGKK